MPFNGSGGTSQPASSIYPATANTLIESTKFNISVADLYTMLASCILKDGQQVATQRIPFAVGISTDTVTEKTSDTGVTLDSVLLKDGRIDTMQGSDIVCSATLNLETATGNVVDVTGSTGPVTAVTLSQGHWRLVRFTGTPTLTNGASLVLPNATDYVVAAGDYILFIGYATSVVRAYIFPTSGPIPFVDSSPVVIGSADKTKRIRFEVDGLTPGATRVITVSDSDVTLGLAPMYIQGNTYGNGDGAGGGDQTNDITITSGSCRDATNAVDMVCTALTKQLDAAWAVGSAAGGLDTGAIGNSDYYIWRIKRSDTGVVDALFSLSSTAPTMPTNYTYKRLVGWFKRVGATIVTFHTYETEGGGLEMNWDAPTLDVNLVNTLTTARRTDAIKVPLNFSTLAHIRAAMSDASTGFTAAVSCPDETDAAPIGNNAPLANIITPVVGSAVLFEGFIRTSSTGTIAARANLATVDAYFVVTVGFRWARRN